MSTPVISNKERNRYHIDEIKSATGSYFRLRYYSNGKPHDTKVNFGKRVNRDQALEKLIENPIVVSNKELQLRITELKQPEQPEQPIVPIPEPEPKPQPKPKSKPQPKPKPQPQPEPYYESQPCLLKPPSLNKNLQNAPRKVNKSSKTLPNGPLKCPESWSLTYIDEEGYSSCDSDSDCE